MATLTVNTVSVAGLRDDNALVAAAGGGDKFLPSKDTFVRVNNAGGGSITVTFATSALHNGIAVADTGGSVTNAQSRLFGPFPAEDYANAADGLCDITYSGVTSVTVGVFKLR